MKKGYSILVFFLIFVVVFLGLEYVGQAMGLLPKRTFYSNLLQTAVVGLIATLIFAIWARRRERKLR